MVHPDKLHCHTAEFHSLARLHHVELYLAQQPVLPELSLNQGEGQLGAVYGNVDFLEQIRQPADMVLVAMGQHHAPELVNIPLQVGKVRNDNIHPQHFRIRERQTAVDQEHVVSTFHNRHILADLVQAAQGNNPDGRFALLLLRLLIFRLVSILLHGQLLLLRSAGLCRLYSQLLGIPVCRLSAGLLLSALGLLGRCSAFTLRTYKALLIFIVHVLTSLFCFSRYNTQKDGTEKRLCTKRGSAVRQNGTAKLRRNRPACITPSISLNQPQSSKHQSDGSSTTSRRCIVNAASLSGYVCMNLAETVRFFIGVFAWIP